MDGRVLEAKNYKSKPELRNSKMLTIFTHHLRVEIIIIVLPAAQESFFTSRSTPKHTYLE